MHKKAVVSEEKRIALVNELNAKFGECLDSNLTREFGEHSFNTSFNIFQGTTVTTWEEKAPLKEKKRWMDYAKGFSNGYTRAMALIEMGDK
jgi:hypothetical protein